MITKQDLENIPHIVTPVEQFGEPATVFRIRTESGYLIHLTKWEDNEETANMYKTVTFIYPNDDINGIIIIPVSEKPENGDICGDVKPPVVTE